jgi:hypothetical protein
MSISRSHKMEHEPRTCSCWYMNETHRRGIGSKFGTPGDGTRTEEEAKEGVKVWENGWVGVSLGGVCRLLAEDGGTRCCVYRLLCSGLRG